jgi:cation transporter-like permease
MIGTLVSAILLLIVAGVIIWAVQQLLPMVPMPEPFARIINILITVVVVLIVVYMIASLFGAVSPLRW